MALHNEVGHSGEEAAAHYLERKGYVIVERNWRLEHLELDIIAQRDNELAIVEVKTLSDNRFHRPEEAVNRQKIRRILRAADVYLRTHPVKGEVHFDIISVTGKPGNYQFEHFVDAFSPIDY